jgi:3-phosphoshikimate 1-carboxyvinyltransferase
MSLPRSKARSAETSPHRAGETVVRGRLRLSGDKSISHRALFFAALASGESRIRGVLRAADVESTRDALRALGADLPSLSEDLRVTGLGLRGLRPSDARVLCGNSGTTARLLAGIVAAHPFVTMLDGDASLRRRPMERVARPLTEMGARVELAPAGVLPMTVHGGELAPLSWRSDVASAQVKSCIILAGLCAGVPVEVSEPNLSRDHTERLLPAMGVTVHSSAGTVCVEPAGELLPLDLTVPADASTASVFAALAACADRGELVLEDVLLNPTRTAFLDTLRDMGAHIDLLEADERHGEPVGTLRIVPSSLRAVSPSTDAVPSMIDELPLLACVATRAEGETVVRGAAELRGKESDRIATVVANLRAIGADAEELDDGFIVRGTTRPLRGEVRTAGDHRIAMAFGMLAVLQGNDISLDDRGCVAVSAPSYWRDLHSVLGGAVT